jgi:hypothetical protein
MRLAQYAEARDDFPAGGVRVDLRVRRLGPNSFGEELSPGAVEDCYLGLLVDQPLAATLPTPGSLVVVGPSALLDARVRQPDGQAVYDLLTGHPDRTSRDLVFLADLRRSCAPGRRSTSPARASTSTAWPRQWCSLPAVARSAPAGTTTSQPGTPRRSAGRRLPTPTPNSATG